MEGSNNPRIEQNVNENEKQEEEQRNQMDQRVQQEEQQNMTEPTFIQSAEGEKIKELVAFRKISQLNVRLRPKIGSHILGLLTHVLCFGYKPTNEYKIEDELNQFIFTAIEESNCCVRTFSGNNRQFEMPILDEHLDEAIHLRRPHATIMLVESPIDEPTGVVRLQQECCKTKFQVECPEGTPRAFIEDPFDCNHCKNVTAPIMDLQGGKIGQITKKENRCILRRNYVLDFDLEMDSRLKACLLGALILFDIAIFE